MSWSRCDCRQQQHHLTAERVEAYTMFAVTFWLPASSDLLRSRCDCLLDCDRAGCNFDVAGMSTNRWVFQIQPDHINFHRIPVDSYRNPNMVLNFIDFFNYRRGKGSSKIVMLDNRERSLKIAEPTSPEITKTRVFMCNEYVHDQHTIN